MIITNVIITLMGVLNAVLTHKGHIPVVVILDIPWIHQIVEHVTISTSVIKHRTYAVSNVPIPQEVTHVDALMVIG